MISPISQIRKLRLVEVGSLALGHTASNQCNCRTYTLITHRLQQPLGERVWEENVEDKGGHRLLPSDTSCQLG